MTNSTQSFVHDLHFVISSEKQAVYVEYFEPATYITTHVVQM